MHHNVAKNSLRCLSASYFGCVNGTALKRIKVILTGSQSSQEWVDLRRLHAANLSGAKERVKFRIKGLYRETGGRWQRLQRGIGFAYQIDKKTIDPDCIDG